MELDKLTLGELREIKQLLGNSNCGSKKHPFKIGQAYLIRTVTMFYIGVLREVYDTELVLSDLSWIPDTGRFADAFDAVENLSEVEPFPEESVILGRGALIDACPWNRELPRAQK